MHPTNKQELWDMIGKGWKLRINKAKTEASLVDHYKDKMIIPCDLALALKYLPELRHLTIMGEPPYTNDKLRRKQNSWIVGVREMGWDESYDWYCHIQ